MLEKELLNKKVWAVVGATQNREKYGNMIYRKLITKGYEVYPVNPVYDIIEGDKCYDDLSSLPIKPDVINIVISPEKAKAIINEAKRLNIEYLWFQPGTFNDEVIALVEELGLKYVTACVLVATR